MYLGLETRLEPLPISLHLSLRRDPTHPSPSLLPVLMWQLECGDLLVLVVQALFAVIKCHVGGSSRRYSLEFCK